MFILIIPKLGITMSAMNPQLASVLFPKVRQSVLALLYGQPGQHFHTNEIIRASGAGTGAVQRELEKLSKSGLITFETRGRQKCYCANPASPLFSEIHAIILKTVGASNVIASALKPIVEKIVIAFIYGSIAKQAENNESDIDLMIISDNITHAELFVLLETAQQKLSRDINPTVYTINDWIRKYTDKNHFVTKVVQGKKIFLIGTEDELNELGQSR